MNESDVIFKLNVRNFWSHLKARMLNAVRINFSGETGICLQNFGIAFSMSFLMESEVNSDELCVVCLWNKISIANATRYNTLMPSLKKQSMTRTRMSEK